jgi:hypothetical protein
MTIVLVNFSPIDRDVPSKKQCWIVSRLLKSGQWRRE